MKKFILMLAISINILAIDILLPKAPPSLPMVKATENLSDFNLTYYTDAVTEVVPNIIKEKDYLYVIPVNLGAKLYNKNKDLQLIGVLSDGLLSIISKDNYNNIKDINNKTIFIGAQGSSPDVISRYIFSKNDMDMKINYRSSQEIFKLLISKKTDLAVLPEPLASLALIKNKDLKRSFIHKDLWKNINNSSSIPQVALFAPKKVINLHKEEIEKLIASYKASLIWIDENKEAASEFGLKVLGLKMPKPAFTEAVKFMNLTFTEGKDSREDVEGYLKALMEVDKNIISRLPGDDFYK